MEIGHAGNYLQIDNVVSFADRVVSPDGDMVYPMLFINDYHPRGVHHNHKYWEMELVLDTNYIETTAQPYRYWPYFLQVQAGDAASRVMKCDALSTPNYFIEWFKVYVREGDGSQTLITFAPGGAPAANLVWCIGETSNFNNETGTRHQTMTYKFICLGEREIQNSAVVHNPGVLEDTVKFMRIDNFTIPGVGVLNNILSFEDNFVMQMTPQFLPNTFQGVDLKQDHRWRILTVVADSEEGAMDPYIDITTANTILPNDFYVEFTRADGLGTGERWTYHPAPYENAYIINRREGRIDDDVQRDTLEYQIITDCDRAIAVPP